MTSSTSLQKFQILSWGSLAWLVDRALEQLAAAWNLKVWLVTRTPASRLQQRRWLLLEEQFKAEVAGTAAWSRLVDVLDN